ncbi:MAG: hypothetical protein ACLPPF_19165 [Rhodomicrobium sp.]
MVWLAAVLAGVFLAALVLPWIDLVRISQNGQRLADAEGTIQRLVDEISVLRSAIEGTAPGATSEAAAEPPAIPAELRHVEAAEVVLLFIGTLRGGHAVRIASLPVMIQTAGKLCLYEASQPVVSGFGPQPARHRLVLHALRLSPPRR